MSLRRWIAGRSARVASVTAVLLASSAWALGPATAARADVVVLADPTELLWELTDADGNPLADGDTLTTAGVVATGGGQLAGAPMSLQVSETGADWFTIGAATVAADGTFVVEGRVTTTDGITAGAPSLQLRVVEELAAGDLVGAPVTVETTPLGAVVGLEVATVQVEPGAPAELVASHELVWLGEVASSTDAPLLELLLGAGLATLLLDGVVVDPSLLTLEDDPPAVRMTLAAPTEIGPHVVQLLVDVSLPGGASPVRTLTVVPTSLPWQLADGDGVPIADGATLTMPEFVATGNGQLPGAPMSLQVGDGATWTQIGTSTVAADGTFEVTGRVTDAIVPGAVGAQVRVVETLPAGALVGTPVAVVVPPQEHVLGLEVPAAQVTAGDLADLLAAYETRWLGETVAADAVQLHGLLTGGSVALLIDGVPVDPAALSSADDPSGVRLTLTAPSVPGQHTARLTLTAVGGPASPVRTFLVVPAALTWDLADGDGTPLPDGATLTMPDVVATGSGQLPGAPVSLQVDDGGMWTEIGTGAVAPDGTFEIAGLVTDVIGLGTTSAQVRVVETLPGGDLEGAPVTLVVPEEQTLVELVPVAEHVAPAGALSVLVGVEVTWLGELLLVADATIVRDLLDGGLGVVLLDGVAVDPAALTVADDPAGVLVSLEAPTTIGPHTLQLVLGDPADPASPASVSQTVTVAPTTFPFTVSGAEVPVVPGTVLTLAVAELLPGTTVRFELQSTPVTLATVAVGADGTAAVRVTVPVGTTAGAHQIVAYAVDPFGTTPTADPWPLTVVAAPADDGGGLGLTGVEVPGTVLLAVLLLAAGTLVRRVATLNRSRGPASPGG